MGIGYRDEVGGLSFPEGVVHIPRTVVDAVDSAGTLYGKDVRGRIIIPRSSGGCWRIVRDTVQAGEGANAVVGVVHYIDRQYYQVGGILQQGSDNTTVEEFLSAGTPFIAARISYGTASGGLDWYGVQLHGYASYADMIADSLNRNYALIPLYELAIPDMELDNPPIRVITDFRAIPVCQAFEMPTGPRGNI